MNPLDGPCVFNYQCKEKNVCGYNNCHVSFGDNYHCCTKNELLKSPNFPFPYHMESGEKTWLLTAPVGSIIILQFHTFNVRLIV